MMVFAIVMPCRNPNALPPLKHKNPKHKFGLNESLKIRPHASQFDLQSTCVPAKAVFLQHWYLFTGEHRNTYVK